MAVKPGREVVEIGLERFTASERAAALRRTLFLGVMIVGSNLPDTDILYSLGDDGKLSYLLEHRGHTHTVAGAVAAFFVRKPGRELVIASAVVLAALAHVGALGTVLSIQWEGAVTGTPGWLRLVAVAQLLATLAAAALLVRAARPRPA